MVKSELKREYIDLIRLIETHEVISFDIYDTVLLRNVLYPTDIFDIVQKELEKENITIKDFKKIRIKSEEKARKYSQFEDVTLQDIYKVFSEKVGDSLSDKIKKNELSIEKRFTTSNPFIKKAYDYAVSNNKKILFISDMYLPKDFICKLLKENGFDKYDGVFLSGEIGLSKASTKIYHHVKTKVNICGTWLHIGDNLVSDYENAIKCNIDAYYYKDIRKRAGIKKQTSIEKSIMKAIQINYCETNWALHYWERFGINIVSSLFFGFTLFLTKNLRGKDNVFFLARDGYIPYAIYEKFLHYDCNLPKAKYLYASRRAYQIPNIMNMKKSEVLNLLTTHNKALGQKVSLGEIFDNIGLDKNTNYELIREFGFEGFNTSIDSDRKRINAQKVLDFIYSDIMLISKKEKLLLEKYFTQNGLYDYDELNVVDVGWSGSTHRVIKDITKLPVNGYYFGTSHYVYKSIITNVYGYAFNLGKPYKTMKQIIDNVMMYELIFSAPHGTVLGFKEEQQQICPVLEDVERNDYNYECLNYIQSSVLSIIDKYLQYYEYLKCIDSEDCLMDYFEFIETKNYEDLVWFSKLTGVVGIGNSQDSKKYVTYTSIKEYYKNRKKLKQEIRKNLWKNALIIKGSASELNGNNFFGSFIGFKDSKLICKENFLKAIKNPKKAVLFLLKIFRLRYSSEK